MRRGFLALLPLWIKKKKRAETTIVTKKKKIIYSWNSPYKNSWEEAKETRTPLFILTTLLMYKHDTTQVYKMQRVLRDREKKKKEKKRLENRKAIWRKKQHVKAAWKTARYPRLFFFPSCFLSAL